MAHYEDSFEKPDAPGSLEQHPLVARLRPEPGAAPTRTIALRGFPGDSDRDGYQRLYLSSSLDQYAEFAVQDMVYTSTPSQADDSSPGQGAVEVRIREDAVIDYTWSRSGRDADPFDLNIRLRTIFRDEEYLAASDFTSCTGCSYGLSCTYCPSHHHCHSHHYYCSDRPNLRR
jgi:hypothetical protein